MLVAEEGSIFQVIARFFHYFMGILLKAHHFTGLNLGANDITVLNPSIGGGSRLEVKHHSPFIRFHTSSPKVSEVYLQSRLRNRDLRAKFYLISIWQD